ncbi:MAG: hypothetical protein GPW18_05945 [Euryarchaeota archaeon]|nr:hypothetical protein [Euryarchaeota archaeon]
MNLYNYLYNISLLELFTLWKYQGSYIKKSYGVNAWFWVGPGFTVLIDKGGKEKFKLELIEFKRKEHDFEYSRGYGQVRFAKEMKIIWNPR